MSQHINIFTKSSISFEANSMAGEYIKTPIDNPHFGILNFTALDTDVTKDEQEFLFVVDQSGSMSDRCSDGRTKMEHILHTLKNMILYLHDNPATNVNVCVFAFDDCFHPILERTKITQENVEEIVNKINKIRPLGSTNIELALKNVGKIIDDIMEANPSHNVNHIFMTDGEATMGSHNKDVLKGLVKPNVHNAFIGFGNRHDSYLLNYLSTFKKTGYYFIDALEKAGLVYGEILHNVLYKLLTDVKIETTNGLIYDYKTNTWVTQLVIGDVCGQANKIYHLVSNTPEVCDVFIEGNHLNGPVRLAIGKLHDSEADYTRYHYRQRTLQLLFEANEIQNKRHENKNKEIFVLCSNTKYSVHNQSIKQEEQSIKKKFGEFFEELKKYMETNNLNEDKFLKNLCDDIYISHRTIGTQFGGMYTSARQTSQGTQRCYTVSSTPEDEMVVPKIRAPVRPRFQRHTSDEIFNEQIADGFMHNTGLALNDFVEDSDPFSHHNVSIFADTPYLTPIATRLMRDVSDRSEHKINKKEESRERSKTPEEEDITKWW